MIDKPPKEEGRLPPENVILFPTQKEREESRHTKDQSHLGGGQAAFDKRYPPPRDVTAYEVWPDLPELKALIDKSRLLPFPRSDQEITLFQQRLQDLKRRATSLEECLANMKMFAEFIDNPLNTQKESVIADFQAHGEYAHQTLLGS